jgi:hypothetical protein
VSRAVRRYQKWEREARESAYDDACGLALDLYHGRAGPLGPYEIGPALKTGEVLYRQIWARYWALGMTTELMDGHGRVRLVPPAWRDWGWCQTVITSQRLATRLTTDGGRLVSSWWANIAGAQVDLGRDFVTLDDRASGWNGAYGALRPSSSPWSPLSASTALQPSSNIQPSSSYGATPRRDRSSRTPGRDAACRHPGVETHTISVRAGKRNHESDGSREPYCLSLYGGRSMTHVLTQL